MLALLGSRAAGTLASGSRTVNKAPPGSATTPTQGPHSRLFLRAVRILAGLFLPVGSAHAAGGHHAEDDAAILEPGQCQIEAWADPEHAGARTLLHLGPACRVGPVELGLNLDRVRFSANDSITTAGPQVKWAGALGDAVSAGLAVSASFATEGQGRSGRYLASTVVVPVTWKASETLLVHVNVGRDLRARDRDDARAGAALEWAALPAWSFVAERFHEGRAGYWRAGARWAIGPAISVDLSRARSLDGSVPEWWTLGVNWLFER